MARDRLPVDGARSLPRSLPPSLLTRALVHSLAHSLARSLALAQARVAQYMYEFFGGVLGYGGCYEMHSRMSQSKRTKVARVLPH